MSRRLWHARLCGGARPANCSPAKRPNQTRGQATQVATFPTGCRAAAALRLVRRLLPRCARASIRATCAEQRELEHAKAETGCRGATAAEQRQLRRLQEQLPQPKQRLGALPRADQRRQQMQDEVQSLAPRTATTNSGRKQTKEGIIEQHEEVCVLSKKKNVPLRSPYIALELHACIYM